jgi:hypothetical protein
MSDCFNMLAELGNCSAPFQCAHGRPSLAPIINLDKLSEAMTTTNTMTQHVLPNGKLNFAKLRNLGRKKTF